jgi:DNA replication protein DnaC
MTQLTTDFATRYPPLTPDQEQAVQTRLSQAEQRKSGSIVAKSERALDSDIGRYRDFWLKDYELYHDAQKPVVKRIKRMGAEIDRVVHERLNVIWWGTIGTGKDLLATWLLRVAASRGHTARWLSARDYYDECQAAFGEGSSQKEVYRKWSTPTVLCLSDPVFEDGWNAKNAEYLSRLVRRRYDAGHATWATCNVKDLDHAKELFGFDVWDRLIEQSVLLECRWPSFRTRNHLTGDVSHE